MKTPDITLAQIVATVGALLGFGLAFGLSLTKVQQDAITNFITVAYPLFLAADAYIRGNRSKALTAAIKVVPEDKSGA
jgi:hypothetical protein